METELHGFGARADVVSAAEGGEEVVQRHLVGQVDDRKAQTPLEAITVEEVVVPYAGIEKVTWGDALRIMIVIFFSGRGYFDQGGSKLRCGTRGHRRSRGTWGFGLAVASEAGLKLLVGSERQAGKVVNH